MSDDYQRRKDIEPAAKAGKEPKYPLNTLEIGESIFVPGGNVHRLCSMVAYANRNRMGCIQKKFTCRSLTVEGIKGVAIIRIAHPVFDDPEIRKDIYARRSDVNHSES